VSDDERAIRAVVAKWMEASKAGDTKAVLGLMTDDVVFMTAGGEPFGKEAFAKASEAQRNVRMDGRSDIRELQVLPGGEWAFVRNYITVTATLAGGKPARREGWTLTILRKGGDGQWRVARDANLMAAHMAEPPEEEEASAAAP
jgi:uncharacterized protein (TIGR02246 family)